MRYAVWVPGPPFETLPGLLAPERRFLSSFTKNLMKGGARPGKMTIGAILYAGPAGQHGAMIR